MAPKITRSPLSTLLNGRLKDVANRTIDVFGVAVHTTGESIVTDAMKHGANPLEYAAEYYFKPDSYFAHYVVGHNGVIVCIADELEKAPHVGFAAEERQAFLSGAWQSQLPAELVARWKLTWIGYKSPAHLFPGPSPNNAYIGIEMLPVVKGCGYSPPPWLKTGRYSAAQCFAVAALTKDIAARWGFPPAWTRTGRLAGHEDLNPLQRHTNKPPAGWDPGSLRADSWFDRDWLRARIEQP